MKLQRVKRLHYQIECAPHVDYHEAPDIFEETESFEMVVSGNIATFEMKKPYPDQQVAEQTVEEYLRSWEALGGLEYLDDELAFTPQDVEIIGVNGSISKKKTAPVVFEVRLERKHISRQQYPPRPDRFRWSADVETLYSRYKAYKKGRERLLSMAYVCLTVVETSAGGRRKAANQYQIQLPVLTKLGELSSGRGSPEVARKAPKTGSWQPLTKQEENWVEAVIKALTKRVGEWVYDPKATLKKLTMQDFPEIG